MTNLVNLNSFSQLAFSAEVVLGEVDLPRAKLQEFLEGNPINLNSFEHDELSLCVNGQIIAKGEIVSSDGEILFRVTKLQPVTR
jgi:flagellar motor switch/type III secretory pathway protein FliN